MLMTLLYFHPSKKALQIMLDICQGYAAEHDVIFNGPFIVSLLYFEAEIARLLTVMSW